MKHIYLIFITLVGFSCSTCNVPNPKVYHCVSRNNPLKLGESYDLFNEYTTPLIYLSDFSGKNILFDVYDESAQIFQWKEKMNYVDHDTLFVKKEEDDYDQLNVLNNSILLASDFVELEYLGFSFIKTGTSADRSEKWDIASINFSEFYLRKEINRVFKYSKITLGMNESNYVQCLLNQSVEDDHEYIEGLSGANFYTLFVGNKGKNYTIDANFRDHDMPLNLRLSFLLIKNLQVIGEVTNISSQEYDTIYQSNVLPNKFRKHREGGIQILDIEF